MIARESKSADRNSVFRAEQGICHNPMISRSENAFSGRFKRQSQGK
jgi:hypothetical protein